MRGASPGRGGGGWLIAPGCLWRRGFPVHVTVRVRDGLPGLRGFRPARELRKAFVYGCNRTSEHGVFRICEFSVQGNHVHLLCEAQSARALSRGIQGFKVRVARGMNRLWDRSGPVWGDRYHARIMRTPTEVRNALCYVLKNRSQCTSSLCSRNVDGQLRRHRCVGSLMPPRTALLKACKHLWPPQIVGLEDPEPTG